MSERPRCLVFGGSGTLGRVVCRVLASQGVRVALTYHTGRDVARGLTEELPETEAFQLDATHLDEIERTVESAATVLGGLEAFVQCVGLGASSPSTASTAHERMSDVDREGWYRMMDVNVTSTFFAVRKVSEVMRKGGGGNVVLIGSVDGVKPVPAPVHYAAAKGAIRGMVQAMAKELGESRIRVNSVAPGILEDGMSRVLPEDLRQEYLKHCGQKRLGRLEEVANVVAWLARDNTYVTGQTLLVDGAL